MAVTPSNPHTNLFGSHADSGANAPRFSPSAGPPASMPTFVSTTYVPYTTSPHALPPLASHYGTNYAGAQPTTNPGAPSGHLSNLDFNSERTFYRPYGVREAAHMSTYPRPPESRGPREFTHGRGSHAHRPERRNRPHDSDNSDFHNDPVDDMDFEESIRDQPRAGENCAKGLDNRNDGRPEPKTEDELKVTLECKVCFSQLVDTVLLPCGHAIMCQWCANQHVPSTRHDKTRPMKPAKCPMCRKAIKQKV